MSLRQYIANVERTYNYRIKTVVPMTDDVMGRIEHAILKYQPHHLGKPRRTMFQSAVLDFPTVQNAEVYMVDCELGLPASPRVLADEIRKLIGLPEKFVIVRGENDPLEIRAQEAEERAKMDEEEGDTEKGALLNLPGYEEAEGASGEAFYGDKYNRGLLGYLKKVEAEKADKRKVDAPNAPFKWLDLPKSDVADDEGPTIGTENTESNNSVSTVGNLDDEKKPFARAYQRQGKTFVKRETPDSVRKGS